MTSTWLWRSPGGLISPGFIAAWGSTPAAAACSAWARPISAPVAVTAELLAMFCALNGATRTPARASHLQMPAVTALFPASEAGPQTHNAPPISPTRFLRALLNHPPPPPVHV